jgi:hypothetical protein
VLDETLDTNANKEGENGMTAGKAVRSHMQCERVRYRQKVALKIETQVQRGLVQENRLTERNRDGHTHDTRTCDSEIPV